MRTRNNQGEHPVSNYFCTTPRWRSISTRVHVGTVHVARRSPIYTDRPAPHTERPGPCLLSWQRRRRPCRRTRRSWTCESCPRSLLLARCRLRQHAPSPRRADCVLCVPRSDGCTLKSCGTNNYGSLLASRTASFASSSAMYVKAADKPAPKKAKPDPCQGECWRTCARGPAARPLRALRHAQLSARAG